MNSRGNGNASAQPYGTSVDDPRAEPRSASADLDRWLGCLQQAMRDTGWTVDALASHWNVDRAFAWRLVNGEKPWSVERVVGLPDDLEARLEHLRAEGFGLIVVAPVSREQALKNLVSGLIGVMSAPELPVKASAMAKAQLPLTTKKVSAR